MTMTRGLSERAAERKRSGEAARYPSLDRLRGLAILLMVLDHVLVVLVPETPAWWAVRLTVTRAALPLFCIVAGFLLQGRVFRWRRFAQLAALGSLCAAVGAPLGIGQPDILLVLAFAYPLVARLSTAPRWSPVALVVAVLQPATWPAPWGGYQPGLVVALMIIGLGLPRVDVGKRLPGWLGTVGRYPRAIYAGHLGALYGAAWVAW